MRLLIISNMSHYQAADGAVLGWGPTAQEIDELSRLFDEVCHVAVLHAETAPPSALPYRAGNVTLVLLPPSGGTGFAAKLSILALSPRYLATCYREIRRSDAIHVRCPANIPLLALLLLTAMRRPRPRWVKYAGNWRPRTGEAMSYRLQRWLLRHNLVRASVTVNGRWPGDSPHVVAFYNPTLTDEDLAQTAAADDRVLGEPVRLLFVGRVEEAKGVGRVLAAAEELQRRGIACTVDVVGDGPARNDFERETAARGVAELVTFHGWLSKLELGALYKHAHFFVLPTTASEGLPKVVCEALAYGCVPITSTVSALRQLLDEVGAGVALEDLGARSLADAICGYVEDPPRWEREAGRASASAHLFSYERYLDAVIAVFSRFGGDLERCDGTRYPERATG